MARGQDSDYNKCYFTNIIYILYCSNMNINTKAEIGIDKRENKIGYQIRSNKYQINSNKYQIRSNKYQIS